MLEKRHRHETLFRPLGSKCKSRVRRRTLLLPSPSSWASVLGIVRSTAPNRRGGCHAALQCAAFARLTHSSSELLSDNSPPSGPPRGGPPSEEESTRGGGRSSAACQPWKALRSKPSRSSSRRQISGSNHWSLTILRTRLFLNLASSWAPGRASSEPLDGSGSAGSVDAAAAARWRRALARVRCDGIARIQGGSRPLLTRVRGASGQRQEYESW